jgi:hypothetical protein
MSKEKSPKFLYQFDGEKETIFLTKDAMLGSEDIHLRPGMTLHLHENIVVAITIGEVNLGVTREVVPMTAEPVAVVKEKRTYKKRAEKVETKEKRKYNKKPKETPKMTFREDDREFFPMIEKGDNFTEGEVAILLKRGLTVPEIEIAFPKRSYQEVEAMVKQAKKTYNFED